MQQWDVKWHEKHLWNCDLLHSLPLTSDQCWWHTVHFYSWPSYVAQVFSALFYLHVSLYWLSQYFKNVLTTCNISEYHSSNKAFVPCRGISLKIIPSFLCLERGFSLQYWKRVTCIPPCSCPGLNLEWCLDALVTKLLFFVGFYSSQHSRATRANWGGAIFNYFLYFAAQ